MNIKILVYGRKSKNVFFIFSNDLENVKFYLKIMEL